MTDEELLTRAMKMAVSGKMIREVADTEVYLRNWRVMLGIVKMVQEDTQDATIPAPLSPVTIAQDIRDAAERLGSLSELGLQTIALSTHDVSLHDLLYRIAEIVDPGSGADLAAYFTPRPEVES